MVHPRRVLELLLAQHGPQNWWPAESQFEMTVGAIVTQRATWHNATLAIRQLRDANLLRPDRIRRASGPVLEAAIRPAGNFHAKARALQQLCEFLARYNDDVALLRSVAPRALRASLLCIAGIGPETADAIMLYAVGVPTFVVDAYARRIFDRLGDPSATVSYAAFQLSIEARLAADAQTLGEFHALLVRHGQTLCKTQRPLCAECGLRFDCQFHNAVAGRA
jgi:endonuclease-3 related protein